MNREDLLELGLGLALGLAAAALLAAWWLA